MKGTKGDNVDCSVVRQALTDAGITHGELARRMGWTRITSDNTRIRRTLGIEASNGQGRLQKTVTYERALELINAMDLDPVDYGL